MSLRRAQLGRRPFRSVPAQMAFLESEASLTVELAGCVTLRPKQKCALGKNVERLDSVLDGDLHGRVQGK